MVSVNPVGLAVGSYNGTVILNSPGAGNSLLSFPVTLNVLAPMVVQITDNETITVTDTASFPDVFDPEAVHVNDAVFVTPLINVGAPVADYSVGSLGFSGQSGAQTITVSNIGQAPLTLSSATISGSSQFTITQMACSNSASSLSTVLASGSACMFTIGYGASATPANDNATVVFTDNAALSNVVSAPAGSSYTQSIALNGSGTSGPPPPPPPAVVPVMDNETITVTDTSSFPDVFDAESITVTDQVSIQVLNTTTTSISIGGGNVYGTPTSVTVSVSSSTATVTGNVTLSLDGGTASTMALTSGSATFNLGTLSVGPHSLAANFAAQGSFLASSAVTKFAVTQATPLIIWKNPAPITYGTPLGSAQLSAMASVPGTMVYSPAAGAVLNAGAQTLSVTFTPNDATDYTTASASVTLVVNQATPTITWASPAPITYGTALSATQLNAAASFGGGSLSGTFTYNPPVKTILGAGAQSLSVTFTPADTTDYTAATASVTLQVNQAMPTIGWATPAPITYGTPLSAAQLNATASVAGTFLYNPALGTILGAGTQTLSVSFAPSDAADYTKAAASVTLVVNQATPTITWANPPAITYGTPLSLKQLNATASVPGTFNYTPAAGTVLSAGSQTLSAVFTPSDTVDYTRAKASVTLVVNQATPTITWASPAPITFGTPLSSRQLNATASVPGTFVYSPAAGTVLNPGTQNLSVTFTPTDTRDYQTVTQTVSITVNVSGNLSIKSGQTYTFTNGSISGTVTLSGGTLILNGCTVGSNLMMTSGSLTLGGKSTVNGNVQIQGGSFTIGTSRITGNLQVTNVAAGPASGVVCGASISGDLQFQYNGIPGQIGPSSCLGNTIGGNLQITNNTAPLQIFKNSVGGNLQVQSNTGSAQVFQNTIQNLLQCSGNSSPFTGGGNTAAGKQGQCASF
jgi:Bacterial Ig-like domain (group 3)